MGGGHKTAGSQARSVKRNRQIVAGSAAERALQARWCSGRWSAALPSCPLRCRAACCHRASTAMGVSSTPMASMSTRLSATTRAVALRTDVSATLFLSEGYEGGDLVIRHSFGEERIKLPAGSSSLPLGQLASR